MPRCEEIVVLIRQSILLTLLVVFGSSAVNMDRFSQVSESNYTHPFFFIRMQQLKICLIIIEKHLQHQQDLCHNFIDFKKVFDRQLASSQHGQEEDSL